MANRRMFSLDVVDTDRFLDMSASAQALYFHLGMRADDDGFVNNPKKICRMTGASEDDLRVPIGCHLVAKWLPHLQNPLFSRVPGVFLYTKRCLLIQFPQAVLDTVSACICPCAAGYASANA